MIRLKRADERRTPSIRELMPIRRIDMYYLAPNCTSSAKSGSISYRSRKAFQGLVSMDLPAGNGHISPVRILFVGGFDPVPAGLNGQFAAGYRSHYAVISLRPRRIVQLLQARSTW